MKTFVITAMMIFSATLAQAHSRIDDGTLIGTIDKIEDTLVNQEHTPAQLAAAQSHLEKALAILNNSPSQTAILVVSDAHTYNFGTQAIGSVSDHVFTLTNIGSGPAQFIAGGGLQVPFQFKGGVYPGMGGTCGATLPSASSCTVVVTYAPVKMSGVDIDTLEITYNDGLNEQHAFRDLSGTSAAPALLTISDGPTYDFGDVKIKMVQQHAFTITNSGGYSASSVNEIGLAAPFSIQGGTCGDTLIPAGSCTIVVGFSPIGTGVANDTFDLQYYNGSATSSASRDVTGQGQ